MNEIGSREASENAALLRSDARLNHDRVLEAAARAFAVDGPQASLRAIARDAGVGIATLYRRFPSRDLLVEAVYRDQSQQLSDRAHELLASVDALTALVSWLELFLDYMATKSGMAESLRALFAADDELRTGTRQMLVDACGALLSTAAGAGAVRADLDPLDVLMALGGFAYVAEEQATPDLRARLLGMLVDGLRV